ncbi:MAG: hypothetical protein ACI81R_002959 [Bradymonadia bacterium]|jgi:hypothetical protein
MTNQLHSLNRPMAGTSRPHGATAFDVRAVYASVGLALALGLGCSADTPIDEAPSWQSEVTRLDAGSQDGSLLTADALGNQTAAGVALLELPETGQRAQQQRAGETTLWFAQYDEQVWEQTADGQLRRSFDDGATFETLPSAGSQGSPSQLLHGGFASDGSFWGVEADTVWHHDGDAWLRHDRTTDFSRDAGEFALIAPDPSSTTIILASADGQLWRHDSFGSDWHTLKSSAEAPAFAIDSGPRFEFDATIAGRVWYTTDDAAWYADDASEGYARWSRDERSAHDRDALPMRAPQDPHWL